MDAQPWGKEDRFRLVNQYIVEPLDIESQNSSNNINNNELLDGPELMLDELAPGSGRRQMSTEGESVESQHGSQNRVSVPDLQLNVQRPDDDDDDVTPGLTAPAAEAAGAVEAPASRDPPAEQPAPPQEETNAPPTVVTFDASNISRGVGNGMNESTVVESSFEDDSHFRRARPSIKNEKLRDRVSNSSRIMIQRHWKYALLTITSLIVFLLATIIVIIFLALRQSNSNGGDGAKGATASSSTAPSTLEMIKGRGKLACGVVEYAGLSMQDKSSGQWSGFEVDLCRAIGAAIFNEDGHVTFTNTTYGERFTLLQSGQVDLLAAGATYTMERDVYEPTAKAGFTFSVPYIYDGVSFAGQTKFVACADQKMATGNCTGLRICVQDGTTHVQVIEDLFPNSSVIVVAPTTVDFYNNFVNRHCNVLAGEQFDLARNNVVQAGYSDDYGFSLNLYSKEPLALVTRDDDPEWSDFVNWVLLALLTAEQKNITQQQAQDAIRNPGPAVVTSQFLFYRAVATVGNYGEMYARYLDDIVPRALVNQQNNGTLPLIYSFPFGSNSTMGEGPIANGTLARIRERGYLLCGTSETLFFADFDSSTQEWGGFDIDYCKAVSAAIFDGRGSTVFVPVDSTSRWELLANGAIDLISWDTTWNYERDVSEPITKQGFTFSEPNLYTGVQFGGIPAYEGCAESLNVVGNCAALKICVKDATTTLEVLRKLFVDKFIFTVTTGNEVADCLVKKKGNAIAADGYFTANYTVRQYGYSGSYQTSPTLFSRENLALVTRQDDPQWSSFVNWVVMATFYADEQSIVQANYARMPTTNIFGSTFTNMFQNAILAVGSRYEILLRHTQGKYNISNINRLNANPYGPQHYPPAGLFNLH